MSPCETRLEKFVSEVLDFQIYQNMAGETYSMILCQKFHWGALQECSSSLNPVVVF